MSSHPSTEHARARKRESESVRARESARYTDRQTDIDLERGAIEPSTRTQTAGLVDANGTLSARAYGVLRAQRKRLAGLVV